MDNMVQSKGLEISGLKVEYNNNEILHGVDLSVPEGSFISLLGPSGCGKTTLLKSIAGLLDVSEGSIKLEGNEIIDVAPKDRGTVIIFQDLRLFPHLSVEQNIAFGMDLRKVDKAVQAETVSRLLREVKLEGYESRRVRQLSGGQQQRIAIARGLAAEPKILLLDEPFSGLDENLRLEMGALVKRLQKELGITMILVTHDKREALQMSDKVALMLDGEIVQYDSPRELFYRPVSKPAANYFGKANYFKGSVKSGVFTSKHLTFATDKTDGDYEAMVRPGAITPVGADDGFRVNEIVFMGDGAECVFVDDEGFVVVATGATKWIDDSSIEVGSFVSLDINLESVRLFPC